MLVTLAGAMSTAELGRSLAPMIRAGLVDAICCTGANLKRMFLSDCLHHYRSIPDYRELSAADEQDLHDAGFNRVTDTRIPEAEAMRCIETHLIAAWRAASEASERRLPHEYVYTLVHQLAAERAFQVPKEELGLGGRTPTAPICAGMGRFHTGQFLCGGWASGDCNLDCVLSGLHYMDKLIDWYTTTRIHRLGFSKWAVALPVISPSALCRCSIKTYKIRTVVVLFLPNYRCN